MAAGALSNDLIAAGKKLLALMDELGLGPEGAAWIYDHDLGEWRFVIASSLVDQEGRRWVYQNLLKVFRAGKFPKEFTILDVFLMGLDHPIYRMLVSAIHVENSTVTFENLTVNNVKNRWSPPHRTGNKERKANFFQSVRKLAHAD
jgi:hypothetical protein